MLMHEKPWVIPIVKQRFQRYLKVEYLLFKSLRLRNPLVSICTRQSEGQLYSPP